MPLPLWAVVAALHGFSTEAGTPGVGGGSAFTASSSSSTSGSEGPGSASPGPPTWHVAAAGQSCAAACTARGGRCTEGAWPTTLAQATPHLASACTGGIIPGGLYEAPVIMPVHGRLCAWQGQERLWNRGRYGLTADRCDRVPHLNYSRVCPCVLRERPSGIGIADTNYTWHAMRAPLWATPEMRASSPKNAYTYHLEAKALVGGVVDVAVVSTTTADVYALEYANGTRFVIASQRDAKAIQRDNLRLVDGIENRDVKRTFHHPEPVLRMVATDQDVMVITPSVVSIFTTTPAGWEHETPYYHKAAVVRQEVVDPFRTETMLASGVDWRTGPVRCPLLPQFSVDPEGVYRSYAPFLRDDLPSVANASALDREDEVPWESPLADVLPEAIPCDIGTQYASGVPGAIVNVVTTRTAYAALFEDGSVRACGDPLNGGLLPPNLVDTTDVRQLFATRGAFAALLANGTAVAWGHGEFGGKAVGGFPDADRFRGFAKDNTTGTLPHMARVVPDVATDTPGAAFISLFATEAAFVGLTATGRVAAWGHPLFGGDLGRDVGVPLHTKHETKGDRKHCRREEGWAAIRTAAACEAAALALKTRDAELAGRTTWYWGDNNETLPAWLRPPREANDTFTTGGDGENASGSSNATNTTALGNATGTDAAEPVLTPPPPPPPPYLFTQIHDLTLPEGCWIREETKGVVYNSHAGGVLRMQVAVDGDAEALATPYVNMTAVDDDAGVPGNGDRDGGAFNESPLQCGMDPVVAHQQRLTGFWYDEAPVANADACQVRCCHDDRCEAAMYVEDLFSPGTRVCRLYREKPPWYWVEGPHLVPFHADPATPAPATTDDGTITNTTLSDTGNATATTDSLVVLNTTDTGAANQTASHNATATATATAWNTTVSANASETMTATTSVSGEGGGGDAVPVPVYRTFIRNHKRMLPVCSATEGATARRVRTRRVTGVFTSRKSVLAVDDANAVVWPHRPDRQDPQVVRNGTPEAVFPTEDGYVILKRNEETAAGTSTAGVSDRSFQTVYADGARSGWWVDFLDTIPDQPFPPAASGVRDVKTSSGAVTVLWDTDGVAPFYDIASWRTKPDVHGRFKRVDAAACYWKDSGPEKQYFIFGEVSLETCMEWCMSLPGCTGLEHLTGRDMDPGVRVLPYCAPWLNAHCVNDGNTADANGRRFPSHLGNRYAEAVSQERGWAPSFIPNAYTEVLQRGARSGLDLYILRDFTADVEGADVPYQAAPATPTEAVKDDGGDVGGTAAATIMDDWLLTGLGECQFRSRPMVPIAEYGAAAAAPTPASTPAAAVAACAARCAGDPRCKAFDYARRSGMCRTYPLLADHSCAEGEGCGNRSAAAGPAYFGDEACYRRRGLPLLLQDYNIDSVSVVSWGSSIRLDMEQLINEHTLGYEVNGLPVQLQGLGAGWQRPLPPYSNALYFPLNGTALQKIGWSDASSLMFTFHPLPGIDEADTSSPANAYTPTSWLARVVCRNGPEDAWVTVGAAEAHKPRTSSEMVHATSGGERVVTFESDDVWDDVDAFRRPDVSSSQRSLWALRPDACGILLEPMTRIASTAARGAHLNALDRWYAYMPFATCPVISDLHNDVSIPRDQVIPLPEVTTRAQCAAQCNSLNPKYECGSFIWRGRRPEPEGGKLFRSEGGVPRPPMAATPAPDAGGGGDDNDTGTPDGNATSDPTVRIFAKNPYTSSALCVLLLGRPCGEIRDDATRASGWIPSDSEADGWYAASLFTDAENMADVETFGDLSFLSPSVLAAAANGTTPPPSNTTSAVFTVREITATSRAFEAIVEWLPVGDGDRGARTEAVSPNARARLVSGAGVGDVAAGAVEYFTSGVGRAVAGAKSVLVMRAGADGHDECTADPCHARVDPTPQICIDADPASWSVDDFSCICVSSVGGGVGRPGVCEAVPGLPQWPMLLFILPFVGAAVSIYYRQFVKRADKRRHKVGLMELYSLHATYDEYRALQSMLLSNAGNEIPLLQTLVPNYQSRSNEVWWFLLAQARVGARLRLPSDILRVVQYFVFGLEVIRRRVTKPVTPLGYIATRLARAVRTQRRVEHHDDDVSEPEATAENQLWSADLIVPLVEHRKAGATAAAASTTVSPAGLTGSTRSRSSGGSMIQDASTPQAMPADGAAPSFAAAPATVVI